MIKTDQRMNLPAWIPSKIFNAVSRALTGPAIRSPRSVFPLKYRSDIALIHLETQLWLSNHYRTPLVAASGTPLVGASERMNHNNLFCIYCICLPKKLLSNFELFKS